MVDILPAKSGNSSGDGNTVDAQRGAATSVNLSSSGNTFVGSAKNDTANIKLGDYRNNKISLGEGDDKVLLSQSFNTPQELETYLKSNLLSGGSGNDTLSFKFQPSLKKSNMDDYLKVINQNTQGFEKVMEGFILRH
jgi:hypothetical protein